MNDDELNRMEEMLRTLIKMVEESSSRLGTVESKLEAVDSRLGTVESKLDTIDGRLETVESRLGTIDDRLETIEADVQHIKINVNELIQGQERQDRILEMLSVKSLETDSYIRDFKRKL